MSEQLNLLAADRRKSIQFRDQVMGLLSDGTWYRAKALCAALPGLTDRALRQIAEQSDGAVISGQRGYRLTRYATNDEIDHAERWLLSQADHMKGRAVKIRRARNNSGRAA